MSESILKDYLETFMAASDVQVASIAVTFGGERHFATASIGDRRQAVPNSVDSRFVAGCLVKTFTAMIGLQLAADGELDLDAPIRTYLGEFKGDRKGDAVSVGHLMCHTSGYAGIRYLDASNLRFGWDDLLAFLRHAPQLFEPGSVFSYDLSAAVLFARIIERITGRPTSALISEKALSRLSDRAATGLVSKETLAVAHRIAELFGNEMNACAPSLWETSVSRCALSVKETIAVAELLMTSLPCEVDGNEVQDAVLAPMMSSEVRLPELLSGFQSNCMPIGWGPGLGEFRNEVHGHDGMGRGESTGLRVSRSKGFAMAIGVKASRALVRQREIVDAVLSEVGLGAPPARQLQPLPVDPERLAGDYIGSQGCSASVTRRDNDFDIVVRLGGSTGIRFKGELTSEGAYSIQKNRSSVGVAFFRDPVSGRPCLMFGDQALRSGYSDY